MSTDPGLAVTLGTGSGHIRLQEPDGSTVTSAPKSRSNASVLMFRWKKTPTPTQSFEYSNWFALNFNVYFY